MPTQFRPAPRSTPKDFLNNLIALLDGEKDSDVEYTPAQTIEIDEILRIRKTCAHAITIKHIGDVEAQHRVKKGSGRKDLDGGIDGLDGKLNIALCETLVQSVLGSENAWVTDDNGISIAKRKTVYTNLFEKTGVLLAKSGRTQTSSGKAALQGVSQMRRAAEDFLDKLLAKHFMVAKGKNSNPPAPSHPSAPSTASRLLIGARPAEKQPLNKKGSDFLDNLLVSPILSVNLVWITYPLKTVRLAPAIPQAPGPVESKPAVQLSDSDSKRRDTTKSSKVKKEKKTPTPPKVDIIAQAAAVNREKAKSAKKSVKMNQSTGASGSGSRVAADEERAGRKEVRQTSGREQQSKKQVRDKSKEGRYAKPSPLPEQSANTKRKAGDDVEEGPSSKRGRFQETVKKETMKKRMPKNLMKMAEKKASVADKGKAEKDSV